jgi:hypothetical protein
VKAWYKGGQTRLSLVKTSQTCGLARIVDKLTVGNSAKNLSPSKRRSCRIHEYIRECALGWKFCFNTAQKITESSLDRKSAVCFRTTGIWRIQEVMNLHYVKTSNRSSSICNGPLTPVTSTHICNGCCLAPVTYKRASTTPGLASTMPVTNVDFW